MKVRYGVRVDQGAAYHRGHLLDGRHPGRTTDQDDVVEVGQSIVRPINTGVPGSFHKMRVQAIAGMMAVVATRAPRTGKRIASASSQRNVTGFSLSCSAANSRPSRRRDSYTKRGLYSSAEEAAFFSLPPMPERPAFMLNQLFYLYGHRWLYDLDELRYALARAGFESPVQACAFGEGAQADVAALDRVFRRLETIYIEVTA